MGDEVPDGDGANRSDGDVRLVRGPIDPGAVERAFAEQRPPGIY